MDRKIKKLQGDITKLTAQKGKLEADLEHLGAEEENLITTLGDGVLAGDDVTKFEEQLAKFDSRRRAILAAIRKATANLAQMEADLDDLQKDQATKQAAEVVERVQGEMHKALEQVREILARQIEWQAQLTEAEQRCTALGVDSINGRIGALRNLWGEPGTHINAIVGRFDQRLLYSSSTKEDMLKSPTLAVELDRL